MTREADEAIKKLREYGNTAEERNGKFWVNDVGPLTESQLLFMVPRLCREPSFIPLHKIVDAQMD